MMPAAKHFDPVLGIDVHMIQPPGPVPPVPVPHPFIGILIDPMDYAPFLGATVMVGGIPRAQAGTAGKAVPSHIPIGGTFIKPPGNECEMFMGSATVLADGDAFSHLALPALSCQDIGIPPPFRMKKKSKTVSLVLPTSVVLSIPSGVLVGGPPTISMMALGMRAGMAAAGALFKKVKGLRKGKGKGKGKGKKGKSKKNAPCGTDAHPVDVVTGACVDTIVDYDPPGNCPFRWIRYYDSSERERAGPMGRGFRHAYELSLEVVAGGYRFTDELGETIDFPAFPSRSEVSVGDGAILRRIDAVRYEVVEPRRRILQFRFPDALRPAVLTGIEQGGGKLRLGHDNSGRLVWAQDSSGRLYQIEHDPAGRVSALHQRHEQPPHALVATVLRYQYDTDGCLVGMQDAFGNSANYQYDQWRLTRMRDRRGYTFWYIHDEQGRVVHTRGEDGLWEARLEYVAEANLTVVRYADGGEWLKFYDGLGQITDVVQPDGGLLTRKFDEDGRLIEEVEPDGRVWTFEYDGFGAMVGRRDQLGRFLPPPWEVAEPPIFGEPDPPRTAAEWEYGALLNPSLSGALSSEALRAVPAEARSALELGRDRPGDAPPRLVLDALGRVISAEYADGSRETWGFDPEGNCVEFTDRDGAVQRREYRSWNLLASETDATGGQIRYQHTLRGQVRAFVDAGGAATEYARDTQERLAGVSRAGQLRESYVWSPGSCLVEKRTGGGDLLLATRYGEHGLPIAEQLGTGPVRKIGYDERGRPVSAAAGEIEVKQAWDNRGRRLLDQCGTAGVAHVFGAEGVRQTTVLDRFIIGYRYRHRWDFDVLDPTGGVHRILVNQHGLVRRSLSSGRTEVAHYGSGGHCLGKFVSGPDAREPWVRRYVHSPAGDLRQVRDNERGTTSYAFDAAHRLIGEQHGHEPERRIRYDLAGNIISMPGLGSIAYEPGNRVAGTGDQRFEHNDRQHVAARHAARRTFRYSYDEADMLVAVSADGEPKWQWRAAYDAFGRRAWKELNGQRTTFWWDGDRLAAERSPDGALRVYVYVDHAALVPFMFLDYENELTDPAAGARRFLFCNQVGLPERVEDDTGAVLWQASAEGYGRLHIDARSRVRLDLRFPGHYFDEELGLNYNRFRYYSPELGRYLQSDPIGAAGGLNVYAYPANPLTRVDVMGLTCSDPPGAGKGKAEGPPGKTKDVKIGDDVSALSDKVGMDPEHLKKLQQRAQSKGERIIVRKSNPESIKWHKEPYNGKPCVSKPGEVKAHTAPAGDPHAGLVKKSKPDEVAPPGHKWDEETGVLVTDPGGNAVHGDYDLQSVTKKDGTPVNTNDPKYREGLNDEVCPEHQQFNHGANDDFKPTKDADGNVISPEGGEKMGRQPDPKDEYLVVEPDGTASHVGSNDELKQVYDDKKMNWPYGEGK